MAHCASKFSRNESESRSSNRSGLDDFVSRSGFEHFSLLASPICIAALCLTCDPCCLNLKFLPVSAAAIPIGELRRQNEQLGCVNYVYCPVQRKIGAIKDEPAEARRSAKLVSDSG